MICGLCGGSHAEAKCPRLTHKRGDPYPERAKTKPDRRVAVKPRAPIVSVPLRKVIAQDGRFDRLECGHKVVRTRRGGKSHYCTECVL